MGIVVRLLSCLSPSGCSTSKGSSMNSGLCGSSAFAELLGHGFVKSAVEVETGVKTKRFDDSEPFDTGIQCRRRVDPAKIFRGVHLDALQSLFLASFAVGFISSPPRWYYS
jgi:hypothetical protein